MGSAFNIPMELMEEPEPIMEEAEPIMEVPPQPILEEPQTIMEEPEPIMEEPEPILEEPEPIMEQITESIELVGPLEQEQLLPESTSPPPPPPPPDEETDRKQDEEIQQQLDENDVRLKIRSPPDYSDPARLLKLMKCVFCGLIPIPPNGQCLSGHLFCASCATRLGSCSYEEEDEEDGTGADADDGGVAGQGQGQGQGQSQSQVQGLHKLCGATIVSPPEGSQLYTELFNATEMACPYKRRGCEQTFLGGARGAHLDVCPRRPSIRCPASDCAVIQVPRADFKEHLVEHGAVVIEGGEASVCILHIRLETYPHICGDYRWIPTIFSHANLDFMLVVQESPSELYMWVALMSRAADDDDDLSTFDLDAFRALILLKEPGAPGRGRLWMGRIWRMARFEDTRPRNEHCLVVGAKRFLTKHVFSTRRDELRFALGVKIGLLDEFRKK